jgi:hypothetical protein
MKVKDIVYEDGPIAGQPQTGKVSKVQPGVGGAPGMVSITKPDGSILTVPTNQITTGIDGKMSVNTQQGQPGQDNSTTPAPTANGQPNITMGQDLQMSEEPGTGAVAQVNTKSNPPTVMDNDTGGSPLGMTKTGEEITPDLIARSTPDWQERTIQANGKTYTALYSGTRGYRVGKQTYQTIMGGAMPMRESTDLSRIKMLSGL